MNILLAASPVIQIHIAAVLAALVVGMVMLVRRKGTPAHRLTGRLWVALMLVVAIGSFGIRSNGNLSWIHLLSVLTIVTTAIAVYLIRRGKVRAHQGFMLGTFAGLVIVGAFTLMPGRLMHQALLGG